MVYLYTQYTNSTPYSTDSYHYTQQFWFSLNSSVCVYEKCSICVVSFEFPSMNDWVCPKSIYFVGSDQDKIQLCLDRVFSNLLKSKKNNISKNRLQVEIYN